MKEETFKESSELRKYSTGVVVKGNSTISATTGNVSNSSQITVSPIETMNAQKQGPIEQFNTVTAEWLAISQPNRASVPNVYPNQSVMLYKYANTEQYFWVTMRHEADLQKAETVTYAYSNIPQDEGWETDTKPVSMNSNNSYFVNIGGSGIFITTPNNRGEITKYKISVDCKNGKISILDDFQNTISLDSKKGNLLANTNKRIHLKSGSLVTIEAPDVSFKGTLYTSGDINCQGAIKTGGSIYTSSDVNCSGTVKYGAITPGASSSAPKRPPSEADIDKPSDTSSGFANLGATLTSQLSALNPATTKEPVAQPGGLTAAFNLGGSDGVSTPPEQEWKQWPNVISPEVPATPSEPELTAAEQDPAFVELVKAAASRSYEYGISGTYKGVNGYDIPYSITLDSVKDKDAILTMTTAPPDSPAFREVVETKVLEHANTQIALPPSVIDSLVKSF